MTDKIRRLWAEQPILLIMGLAVFFRLLCVIFAKGWGMIDDHFLVIEAGQSWADGTDYNDWLPGSPRNHGPTGHNLFYPGLHYLLFLIMKAIGFTDPQGKMYVVRALHAIWSLVTVYFGYRLVERLSGKEAARLAGLLLAVYWFMPWMSVRNLVEMAGIPFLVLGFWFMLREEPQHHRIRDYLIAGFFFGMAFNIRFQDILFPVGAGLALLIRLKWKECIFLALGVILPVIVIQGGTDYFVWGRPFAEIQGYIRVNIHDRYDYITLPWYNYFLVILGLLVPPVSFFLFFGFLRTWKKILLIFLPCVVFFAFHSYFPNKQERFILPMIPFFIMLGTIGWVSFVNASKFWTRNRKLYRACWIFFWVFNSILLVAISLTYSKKARVETMHYLSRYPDVKCILVYDATDAPEIFPEFYLGQWIKCYDELEENETTPMMIERHILEKGFIPPAFVLFTQDQELQSRVILTRKYFPGIVYETTIETGLMDKILHRLNPINKNRRVYIYRNTELFPKKID